MFNIISAKNLDTQSLYNQRRARAETVIEEITFEDDSISDDFRQEKVRQLLKNNIFGKKEIDQHVKDLLQERKHIEAAEVPLETQEDYVKLILIFLYSKSVGMHYDVQVLGKVCNNNFVSFQNFRIKGV
ncbi:MAG: hypothetical protein IH571_00865 [Acholeplasmataceae bacterium]|nr:hypothetical protein [Acholeplasmataceae bacterium]